MCLFVVDEKMNVKDYGDITYDPSDIEKTQVPNMPNYGHISRCNHELSKGVQKIINEGRICLTLGGDHSIGW